MLTLHWQHADNVCQYNVKMSMIHWAFDFKTAGDFFFVHYHFGRKKPTMKRYVSLCGERDEDFCDTSSHAWL